MQLDPHSGFVQASKSSLKDWSVTQDYHTQTVSQFFTSSLVPVGLWRADSFH